MRAREVLFVLFVIFCGLIISWVAKHQGCEDIGWRYQSYSYSEEETLSCPPHSPIEVENRFGDVKISSWDRALLRVAITKRVWASNKRKAEGVADQLKLIVNQEGDVYRVSTNRDELIDVTLDFETNLTLMVPLHAKVRVDNHRGEVEIKGLAGNQKVENDYDDILASDIDGNLEIESTNSDIVVEDIRGGLTVRNIHGEVTITKVEGELQVENPYGNVEADEIGGMVQISTKHSSLLLRGIGKDMEVIAPYSRIGIREVEGSLRVKTSSEPVEISDVGGEVIINGSNSQVTVQKVKGRVAVTTSHQKVMAEGIEGELQITATGSAVVVKEIQRGASITTSNQPVSVEGFRGEVSVETTNAPITLSTPAPLVAGIRAVNSNGNIHLSLPEEVSFQIEAIAFGGRIISDLQDPNLRLSQQEENSFLTGTYREGGPKLYLKTDRGDIILKKHPSAGKLEEPPHPEN